MAGRSPPGPQHIHFTAWAKDQGVKINGVGPAKISGSGIGIVAERRIEAGEELVKVPASALFTINCIPRGFMALHEGITVHGLLASFLAVGGGGETSIYEPWKATWPSMREFEESMPILWPDSVMQPPADNGKSNLRCNYDEKLASVLPPAIGGRWRHAPLLQRVREDAGLLTRQVEKLTSDWETFSRIFPATTWEDYAYWWLIVNTRSFYFELPDATSISHEDRMVMCPFVDYFNHNDNGCIVLFDKTGYTVISDRAYEIDEELHTSYGSHSNDFLLCEYGFMLENNKFDYLQLDDLFCEQQIHHKSRKCIEAAGYLGNYTLNSEGVCFRTQVAIRRITLNSYHWKRFMAGTFNETELTKGEAAVVLHEQVLRIYEEEAEEALSYLDKKEPDGTSMQPKMVKDAPSKIPTYAKDTLLKRWRQILALIHQAMEIHETRYYCNLYSRE